MACLRFPFHTPPVAALVLTLALLAATAPAGAVQLRKLPVSANDVVYNPHDGMLYVSVPGDAPLHGNTITRVNPVTGDVGPSLPIGSEPRKLALSSDGSALWVGLDGAAAIRKVDLATFTAGPQYSLGNDPFLGPLYAEDIEVLPGSPGSVAVSLRNQGFSPRHMGVAVYDDGVRRPTMTPGHTGSNVIVFSSTPSRLYGQNIETTEYGFRRMDVTAAGVTVLDVTQNLLMGFGGDIFFDNGRVYSTGGEVIDPEARILLGRFPFPDFTYGSAMAPDGNRAYFAVSSYFGQGAVRLLIFDTGTFTQVLAYPLAVASGTPTALRRWGPQGLALRVDDGTLYLLEDIQSPPTCDVALSMTDDRDPVAVNDDIYYRIEVANRGDAPAEGVKVRDPVPALTSFQYASFARGSCYDSLGTIVCSTYAPLAPADSFEILVDLRAVAAGTATNAATASTTTPDANPDNNAASQSTEIREPGFDRTDTYVSFAGPVPARVVEGESFDLAVEFGNRGPADATAARLDGTIYGVPADYEVLSGPGCTPNYYGGTSCDLGTLPAASHARMAARVRPRAPGYLSVAYGISAHQQDRNYDDNYISGQVVVLPSATRLVDSLSAAVSRLDLNKGEHNVLARQLADAQAALAARDTADACKELGDFQEWMSRWTGRALDLDQSYARSVECRMIQELLGCLGPIVQVATAARGPIGWGGAGGGSGAGASAAAHATAAGAFAAGATPEWIQALPTTLELRASSWGAVTVGMPAAGPARLELIDVQGRLVRTVFAGTLPAGRRALPWDASGVSSGIYFYRLTALGRQSMIKAAIVR